MELAQEQENQDFNEIDISQIDIDINEGAQPEHQNDVSIEDQAKAFGWKPEEEWNPEEKEGQVWLSAEEFVKKRSASVNNVKKANTNLTSKLKKMESAMDTIIQHQERQLQIERENAYNQAISEIKRSLQAAVENGDIASVENLIKARDDLHDSFQPTKPANNDNKVVEEWVKENQWYSKNEDLQVYAAAYEDKLARQGIDLSTRLQMTAEKVKQTFPAHFGSSAPSAAQTTTISAGAKPVITRSRGKVGTYEGLLPEAKKSCDEFVSSMVARGSKADDARAEFLKYLPKESYYNN